MSPQQPNLRTGDRAATGCRAASGVRDVGAGDHAGHSPWPAVDHHATRLRTMGTQLRNAFWHWTSGATRGNGVELMSVYKRKYLSGTVLWYFKFQPPGAVRRTLPIRQFGFATKQEAVDAEANRRIEEQQKHDLAKSGSGVAAALPKTLSMLIRAFILQHAEEKLAPKTVERYTEQLSCLDPALLKMPLADITPLHLSREWNRLLKQGGHTRRDKTPRPLSAKTVRNIAGVVSSAFTRATGPWCLPMLLEMSAATGARRGEVLALRWSDIQEGRQLLITRSLTQTRQVLQFKGTKTEKPRLVELPASVLAPLEGHRRQQEQFRQQYGPDYRADLDLLFSNPDVPPRKPDSVSAAGSLLCRRLGLPNGASLLSLR